MTGQSFSKEDAWLDIGVLERVIMRRKPVWDFNVQIERKGGGFDRLEGEPAK